MYIKQIILQGFKSYKERTVVKGFDPLFNAITGLNGSGKSNILDAICFVLGLSNLQQVYAHFIMLSAIGNVFHSVFFPSSFVGESELLIRIGIQAGSNKDSDCNGYSCF
jgi:recombinational DNA repair ATPase RecF